MRIFEIVSDVCEHECRVLAAFTVVEVAWGGSRAKCPKIVLRCWIMEWFLEYSYARYVEVFSFQRVARQGA